MPKYMGSFFLRSFVIVLVASGVKEAIKFILYLFLFCFYSAKYLFLFCFFVFSFIVIFSASHIENLYCSFNTIFSLTCGKT